MDLLAQYRNPDLDEPSRDKIAMELNPGTTDVHVTGGLGLALEEDQVTPINDRNPHSRPIGPGGASNFVGRLGLNEGEPGGQGQPPVVNPPVGAPSPGTVSAGGGGPSPQVQVGDVQGNAKIVDMYVTEGKYVGERVVSEHFMVGVKPYRTIEKIVEIPQVVVKEVTKVVKRPEIQERVVEKPKIEIVEKIQEVPQVKIVEKIIDVPEVHVQEKIVEVPKIIYEDRVIEVPKVIYEEKIEYVDRLEYREVIVDKVEEEIVTEKRIKKRVIKRPVPMIQYVHKDKYVPLPSNIRETQEVDRTEEIPKISFQDFPVRKKIAVPMYRAVFPDGTKRVVNSIPGYPVLPRPKSYVESCLGVEDTAGGARKTKLGVNANLVNTTRPPPIYQSQAQSQSRSDGTVGSNPLGDGYGNFVPGRADEKPAQYNMIPPSHATYISQGTATGNYIANSVHPEFRSGNGGVGGANIMVKA